jgi:beta-glucosidase
VNPHAQDPTVPVTRFPGGFLWGTASAAHQVEGGNRNSDWWEFEHQPGRIANGDTSEVACDHYHRYREDFAMLRELNQNAHRLSIEWARIEPAEGAFDQAEIAHYRDVLGELRDQGLLPMVTLHHFSSPLWFARRGGWSAPGSAQAFLPFVERVVDELGDLVAMWCTVNEPNIYAAGGWLTGEFPPGVKGALARVYHVTANMRRAHELSYVTIKRKRPDALVGLSHHKFLFLPATPRQRDRWAANTTQLFLDRWPVAPARLRRVVDATSDFIGIAHYWGQMCAFDLRRPKDQFIRRFNVPGADLTDMGWTSDPAWMRRVLNELRGYGKPVYITENGLATSDDERRVRYLDAILANVALAIQDGVDVRGYFHWTNMDNFEWARGYSARFGLISVDRSTLERTVKPSGRHYARIAAANGLG